ncbi:uncharacterized protein G2W53_021614 [Senna tora]|uniref:Uncharacterized protein n=1 Tax=Senna tora TaxID=362788 RepID=A0A834TKI5_9FABA|nr:uncharacterized protein G2W53_021614 [Senna tora]
MAPKYRKRFHDAVSRLAQFTAFRNKC